MSKYPRAVWAADLTLPSCWGSDLWHLPAVAPADPSAPGEWDMNVAKEIEGVSLPPAPCSSVGEDQKPQQ